MITGGNSGIELATARRFVAEGAFVFITGRRRAELDAAARELGPTAFPVRGDVARPADLDQLYATVEREKGDIDVLFANAGTGMFAPLGEITEEQFDRVFDLNVRGLPFSVQQALPPIRGGGSIILNASVVASKGMPASGVSSASKAAARSFARPWATDLKGRNIRVNAVSPGMIPTPAYSTALGMSPEQVDQFTTAGTADIPLERPGSADEVAATVLFLASAESSYVTGVELLVDGGLAQV